jgi:hypothetical protein
LIGGDHRLDFRRSFLPESLAGVESLEVMSPTEKLALNQIRGHGYLYTFGLVEEFILPFVLEHAQPSIHRDGEDHRLRALLTFAGEEAKHIELFKRFRDEFTKGFGIECEGIGPPEAIAKAILSRGVLAVALTVLHIEWMTQRHYLASIRDDAQLDPQFKSLLKHHWMEEAQHAKLDTLLVGEIVAKMTSDEVTRSVAGYLEIGAVLDGALKQQVLFDLDAFGRKTGRRLSLTEKERLYDVQLRALRWTFLGSGMTHETFLDIVERLTPEGRQQVEAAAPAFC